MLTNNFHPSSRRNWASTVTLCALSIGLATLSVPAAMALNDTADGMKEISSEVRVPAALETPTSQPIVAPTSLVGPADSVGPISEPDVTGPPPSITAQNLAQAKVSTKNVTPSLVSMSRVDAGGIEVDKSVPLESNNATQSADNQKSSDDKGTVSDSGSVEQPAPNHFKVPPISGRLIAMATPENVSPLEENTKAILLKLIELEKYNLNYHLNVAKQGRWKGWRYFISQEGNNMTSGAGAIVGTVHRMSHLGNPTRLHRTTLENGNVLGLIGQTVGASGSGVEFLINAGHDIAAHRHGYGPKAARTKVLGIRKDIDNLMADREKIIADMSASGVAPRYIEMARAEEPVLMDIRNLSLNEFKQFHTHLRRVVAFQQSLYIGDILRNTCGAIGNRLGWDALRFGNRHFNNSAGVMYNISGLATMLNPFVSRGIGKLVQEYEEHYIRKCMEGVDSDKTDVDKLAGDIAKLKGIANAPELEQLDLPVLRAALYADHETGVRAQVHLEEKELRAGVLTAAENIVSGTFIGATKVAGGAIFNVAGTGFVHSARGTNQLLAAANVCSLAGCSYGTVETARIQIKREFQYQNLKKKKELPGQIMKNRLAQLDKMEQQLRAKTN